MKRRKFMIRMFLLIFFSDNQQRLFNPYCTSMNLLESIRKQCHSSDDGATLDLSDGSGNVKNLHSADNLQSYANSFLEGRETYWLIKVEKGATEREPTIYSLLISNPEETCPELQSRLKDLSRPPSMPKGRESWTNVRKKLNKTKSTLSLGKSPRNASGKGKR
ncbi:uncharacterized protein CXorf65 homolog isoform X2 [Lytechinus pictus]|uniref:uncharacterized protein CXorf65 homolog isoform X2 n=1 Tax=Lytechinus pictus TaxID=7653 RepID=UPI0030B9B4CE